MNGLRTSVWVIGLACAAYRADAAAPRLTLRCGAENDLYRV